MISSKRDRAFFLAVVLFGLVTLVMTDWEGGGPTATGRAVEAYIPVQPVNIGDMVQVDLLITDVDDLYGFQIDVSYDDSILTYDSVAEGTFLSENGTVSTFFNGSLINGSNGLIDDILVFRISHPNGTDGNGTLATIYFNATNSGISDVQIVEMLLANSTSQNVSGQFSIDTNITVLGDTNPPTISGLSPADDSWDDDGLVTFLYTPEDDFSLRNCSLFVEGSFDQVNTSPTNGSQNQFVQNLSPTANDWYIQCYDLSGNSGLSSTYTVNIVSCGDSVCTSSSENCSTCESDCNSCSGSFCGDDNCDADESCSTCESDCGPCSSGGSGGGGGGGGGGSGGGGGGGFFAPTVTTAETEDNDTNVSSEGLFNEFETPSDSEPAVEQPSPVVTDEDPEVEADDDLGPNFGALIGIGAIIIGLIIGTFVTYRMKGHHKPAQKHDEVKEETVRSGKKDIRKDTHIENLDEKKSHIIGDEHDKALKNYIKEMHKLGKDNETIRSKLLEVGWKDEQIAHIFGED